MAIDIGHDTRIQMLSYRKRASINVIQGRGNVGQVAQRLLTPDVQARGIQVLDPSSGSALIAISMDSARKIASTLNRLEEALAKAINQGTTLAGTTATEPFLTWKNDSVTTGLSRKSTAEYEYGDRSLSIKASSSYGLIASGVANSAVDGSFTNNSADSWQLNAVSVQGHWIQFDFGEENARIIDETTWHSTNLNDSGTWQWHGSNDGLNFSALGTSFTLGGEAIQTIDALNSNSVGYRYYRMVGISGTADADTVHKEVLFRSAPSPVQPDTYGQISNALSSNTIDKELKSALIAIDNIVNASSISGANLIAGTSRTVALQTTPYGGKMEITTRPMDSRSLGLSGISALGKNDAKAALYAIRDALASTATKLIEFQYIQNGLQAGKSRFSGSMSGGATILPSGSLIDLLA